LKIEHKGYFVFQIYLRARFAMNVNK
jgi:hypothetical protein